MNTRLERLDDLARASTFSVSSLGSVPEGSRGASVVERFLLVEHNVVSGYRHGTLHASMEEAADYSQAQEYALEWAPVALYDLDTGERYTATQRVHFMRVE